MGVELGVAGPLEHEVDERIARKRSAAAAARAAGGAAGEAIRASAVSGMVDHTRRAAIVRPSDSPATAPSGESETARGRRARARRSTPAATAGVGQRLARSGRSRGVGTGTSACPAPPARIARATHAPGGARAHAATGLLAGELRRIDAPDLARVGEVEALAEGGPEGGHQHLGEGVRARPPAQRAQGGVAQRAGGHAGGRRRTRSSGRRGKAIQRPPRRMRPCRGRVWRSSPSSARSSARIRGSMVGCRRWLPRSTRTPATSRLAAAPPTNADRSSSDHAVPRRAPRGRRRRGPAGPAPSTSRSQLGALSSGRRRT